MTDPDIDSKSNGDENEKSALDNSVTVPIDIDESKAQLINSNGGAGDHGEVAIVDPDKSSDQMSFNGLGKEEVMEYANDPFWVRLRWVLFILFWVGWLAMLVTAIVIIVLAPRCPPRPDLKWYQKDVIYQAYSKSFKDSDKDGFGDFKGLKDKFDYITDGVGAPAVYLNAIYKTDSDASIPSDEKDLAIVDHKELNEEFKTTFAKFKSWIKDLRKKGQQVILDLIPNHTSKKHEWFEKSKSSDKDYKDYYIWADSPNNWKNINGDSAWTKDDKRGQYYYHSRSSHLPDLNLNNKAVREEIKDIMKFWFGAGVGGFNIQDLEYLVEGANTSVADDADFTQTQNTEGTLDFLEELRSVANSYSDKPGRERFLFGNVMNADVNQTEQYWGDDNKRLHLVLPVMGITGTAEDISQWIDTLPDGNKQWLGLQLGNENTPRVAGRSTDSGYLKIAHAIQMLLPGTPFNYYGDEFGQKDGNEAKLTGNRFNPLNARTPMQWNDEDNAGFTDADVTPWVALGQDYKSDNLRVSRAHYNAHSPFRLLNKLVELRKRESFQWGKTKACAPNKDVLLFTRKANRFPYFLTMINMGQKFQHPHLPSLKDCVDSKEKGTVVFHSSEDAGEMKEFDEAIKLAPGDIVVIEFSADE